MSSQDHEQDETEKKVPVQQELSSNKARLPPVAPGLSLAHSVDEADPRARFLTDPGFGNESGVLRMRSNTEPVDLSLLHVGGETTWKEPTVKDDLSSPEAQVVKSSDDDEEVKKAKAMALAIQNNPNMTPSEILELLAKEQISTSTPIPKTTETTAAAAAPLIPGRLTSMMFPAGMTTTTPPVQPTPSSLDTSAESHKMTFRERARGRFHELTGNVAKHLTTVSDDFSSSSATQISAAETKISPSVLSMSPKESSSAGLRLRARQNVSKSARTPPLSPTPTDSPAFITSVRSMDDSLLPPLPTVEGEVVPTTPAVGQQKSAPIRMSGIAWKRRGGMGKFSSTAAWERRRIELQGTKLLYYLRDESEVAIEDPQSPNMETRGDDVLSSMTSGVTGMPSLSDDAQDQATDGVVVAKRANWLEHAASHWGATSDDPTAPRGYIDLAKEKATVHAAYGGAGFNSAAPSPFALSIKVRGETRWKLCFDYHKTQMEWLAAITDVVVQNSVDSYNAMLLQAIDPANHHMENTLFHPPALAEPPTPDAAADVGHRLWMTESYVFSSNHTGGAAGEALGETEMAQDVRNARGDASAMSSLSRRGGEPLSESMFDADDEANQETIADSAAKTWTVPEKNILYVVGVLNVALAYARASSTSMEGFWYLVTLANLGVYLCLTKEPHWRSILKQSFLFAQTKALNNNGLRKRRKSGQKAAGKVKDKVKAKPKIAGYIPAAGCSTVKLDEPSDPPVNSKGEHFGAWRTVPGETCMVRSHGYLTTKEKVPSPGSLYELVNVDIFESPQRYPDMAVRVKLPKVEFNDGQKTWRAPDLFIISFALPTDPPKLGRNSSDGGGYTITMYYRMKQETRDILKRVTADGYDASTERVDDPQKSQINAVRLFEEWCRRAPTDDKFQSRFKVVPNAHNLKEIGVPGWISKYNGKPFLIKRPGQTGFLFSHPELSCMEFDISLHPFPYLAKQAICYLKESVFKKVLVTFGFVIEGRSDDELPECLIGLMQLCYPNPAYAIQADEFFAGTCPRSF